MAQLDTAAAISEQTLWPALRKCTWGWSKVDRLVLYILLIEGLRVRGKLRMNGETLKTKLPGTVPKTCSKAIQTRSLSLVFPMSVNATNCHWHGAQNASNLVSLQLLLLPTPLLYQVSNTWKLWQHQHHEMDTPCRACSFPLLTSKCNLA